MAVWILICPLLAALLCAAFARRAPRLGMILGVLCTAVGAGAAIYEAANGRPLSLPNVDILHSSYIDITIGGTVLSDRMCWIGVSFALVILLQAAFLTPEIGAEISRRDAWRAALIWFVLFANAVMLSAQNVLHLLIGWHLVSLAVFVALGFNYRKSSARGASLIGFVTQRLADFAMTVGMISLILQADSIDFAEVTAAPASSWCAALIAFALLAKTAQPLFHAWLVRAADLALPALCALMLAGPFSAGIFALYVLYPALDMTPALALLGWIATLTALLLGMFAAAQTLCARTWIFAATAQTGLVLATIARGGAGMDMALLSSAAVALLALATTSATRAMEGEQDLRFLGGLGRKMPLSFMAMIFGALSVVAAIGYLPTKTGATAEILSVWLTAFVLGLAVVRFVFLLFAGRERGHKHAHDTGHAAVHSRLRESPLTVLLPMLPLVLLPFFAADLMSLETTPSALAAVLGGFFGLGLAVWRGASVHRSAVEEALADGLFIIPLIRELNDRIVTPLGHWASPDISRFLTAAPREQNETSPRSAGQFALWIGLSCAGALLWAWWRSK